MKVFEIPTDKLSINARKKYRRIKEPKYDPQNCEICKISCNSKTIYDIHVEGKKHKKALAKFTEAMFLCTTCSLTFDTLTSWEDHIKSYKHIIKEQNSFSETLVYTIPNQDRVVTNAVHYCDICKLDCGTNIILQSHMTGSKHKRKLKLVNIEKLKAAKDSAVYCDICDIVLEPELMTLHKKSNKHKQSIVKEEKVVTKPKNIMKHCVICEKDFSNTTEALDHYDSNDHTNNLQNNENKNLYCVVCKILLPNETMMGIHLKGFRHFRILNRSETSFEGNYKEKIAHKREKDKELREQFSKEKEN